MPEVENTTPADSESVNDAAAEVAAEESTPDQQVEVEVKTPEFEELAAQEAANGTSIDRFYDVSVSISAELGRVSMPLGELLRLGEGAVVKLDRPVSAPVELMAQGVRVALGEVVVVDDCFAIRIREIQAARRSG
jgi:flagellar motor switch protein FliN/FliY